MPAGWGFAILLSALYLGEGIFADQAFEETDSAPRSLIAVTLQYLVVAGLLAFRRMSSRLPQTLTALAGTGILFGAISILLVLQAEPGTAQPLLVMLWFGAFIWSLLVDAHIYRRAMSLPMRLGMLIAVLIFALNFIVIQMVYPA